MKDDKYGVLLFEEAWEKLAKALEPYQQEGLVGKYIYCNKLEYGSFFVTMTITPKQVQNRIECNVRISIPYSFVKFIAQVADSDRARIGFRPKR